MKLTLREQTKQRKKEKILKLLEDLKIASTGKIRSKLKTDAYRTLDLLEELLSEKLIIKISMPNTTYWELK